MLIVHLSNGTFFSIFQSITLCYQQLAKNTYKPPDNFSYTLFGPYKKRIRLHLRRPTGLFFRTGVWILLSQMKSLQTMVP